jgi:predicted metal-dependent hydrolase
VSRGPEAGQDSGELPEFVVRRSPRARRARIDVTPRDGVVVVVPVDWSEFDAEAAVRERRAWIEESLARIADHVAALRAEPAMLLPPAIEFPATGESWRVRYVSTGSTRARAVERGGVVRVTGGGPEQRLQALQRWLHRSAVRRLAPRLEELAAEAIASGRLASRPAGIGVRAQHARWGGCSDRGYITLNRALLFLAPELVRAVMLHELVHLDVPDHSAAFWGALRGLDEDADAHRAEIAAAWDSVPAWAEWRPRR